MHSTKNDSKVPVVPEFPFKLSFESRFDTLGVENYLQESYHHSFYGAVVYLLTIHLVNVYMQKREPFNIKGLLVVWNTALAAMSCGGALRTVPELYHAFRYFGLEHTICNDQYYYTSTVMACWSHVIVVSKVLELFDTLFIVLRKRKITFLHWFHHSTVLVFTWIIAKDRCAITRWYMSMNYCVHSFMYSYYALRALKVNVPRRIAMVITTSQIVQMLIGFFVSLNGFFIWSSGKQCAISGRVALFGTTLYTFYFILFADFFVKSYVQPRFRKLKKT